MIQWDFPVDEPVSLPTYRRRRLDESIDLIAEQIRSGTSIRALANEYGVSRQAIPRALARAGIAIAVERGALPAMPRRRARAHRLPGRGRSRMFTRAEATALLARREGGESIRALARATGVSHETMRQTLARVARAGAGAISA